MQSPLKPSENFDVRLALECAEAFSGATGLGCTITDTEGTLIREVGYGTESCELCRAAGQEGPSCALAHRYGMTEAERFGGKYIYFCPMGLVHFVSPIVGGAGSEAKITVGPLRMVDREDFIDYDLVHRHRLAGKALADSVGLLSKIPYVSPAQVNSYFVLLFMAVGFMNNVSAAEAMLETQNADYIQGQLGSYILELKRGEESPGYPIETERALLASIGSANQPQAQKRLNELLGYILFQSGGDLARIRVQICELLTLISRAAIDAGAPPEQTLEANHQFCQKSQQTHSIEELCVLITRVMTQFMDSIFSHVDIKHADIIHKTVHYLRENYNQKITLEEMARRVYLSPSYFSKIFKKEMGCNFSTYLNRLRIENSKILLRQNLRLVDIASMVGFEDQSYFTKIFKKVTGLSPNQYREKGLKK